MNGLLDWVRKNVFLLCLLGAIFIAWLYPFPGTDESPFHLGTICTYGVSIIFFFYGLRLSPEQLKAGLVNWKLHVLVQSITFILFPLLVLTLKYFFDTDSSSLWLGAFYLAALPSTVSSSVVMVSIAGGNIPAAIFNASISSIIGILITPLWMGPFLENSQGEFAMGGTILKLCLQVLLPVIVGFLLHNKLGKLAERFKTSTKNFDQFIILLIVYTSFCESFSQNMFSGFSLVNIIVLGTLMLALFAFVFILTGMITTGLRFSKEDRITALFCGSKKSLVQGAVMGQVLFPDQAVLGIVLLPLMLYHALQLLAGSTLAHRMARKAVSAKS